MGQHQDEILHALTSGLLQGTGLQFSTPGVVKIMSLGVGVLSLGLRGALMNRKPLILCLMIEKLRPGSDVTSLLSWLPTAGRTPRQDRKDLPGGALPARHKQCFCKWLSAKKWPRV